MTSEKKQEYTLRITHANRTQLIVILYEIVTDYIREAQSAEETGDREAFRQALRCAKSGVRELTGSLDFEYDISGNLYQLYRFVHRQLIEAEVKQKTDPLTGCLTVIQGLREAYEEVGRQDTSGALLENTQTVYSGLTYGRDRIHEELTDEGINRGFRA